MSLAVAIYTRHVIGCGNTRVMLLAVTTHASCYWLWRYIRVMLLAVATHASSYWLRQYTLHVIGCDNTRVMLLVVTTHASCYWLGRYIRVMSLACGYIYIYIYIHASCHWLWLCHVLICSQLRVHHAQVQEHRLLHRGMPPLTPPPNANDTNVHLTHLTRHTQTRTHTYTHTPGVCLRGRRNRCRTAPLHVCY